ncbi:MFS transporter [bacterium]|nr:MFS transporter [bacterium]MDG1088044.1 MFS transporter [Acidimicrobiales bacterium]
MSETKIDHVSIGVLGVLTICAYGSWYYSFGVLLEPIRRDTGWSESTLASSFSAGTILIGISALFGGRMLDRVGHRPVFLLGGVVGTTGLVTASTATHVALFFVGAAIGLAAFGSLGFYHVTMTTAVRLNPDQPTRAIAVLTIWGALASAIFLPGSDWLQSELGWRVAVRVLAGVTGLAFLTAAAVLPATEAVAPTARPSVRQVLASTVSAPAPRLFTIAVGFGGLAMSTMLVFQVPVMTAAGLGSATAASMAGLRGFCQLGGRIPLSPLVNWLGRDRALILAFAAMTIGGVLLSAAGNMPVAVAFAIVAGFGIGAFSPLQGMKGEELFERDQLGATMGVYGAVLLLVGSPGPIIGGVILERTGEARWVTLIVIGAATIALTATVLLARLSRSGPTTHRERATSTG